MLSPLLLLCAVVDGDTLRCDGQRYRLLAIDAPDRTTAQPCRQHNPNYVCDDRAAEASARALRRIVTQHRVRLEPVSRDRYGRPVVVAYVGRRNLSCEMLRRGHARYVVRYDNGGRIRQACPTVAPHQL